MPFSSSLEPMTTSLAADVCTACADFPLAGNVVELQPAVCAAVHDALGAEDHAVIAGVQLGEGVLNVSLGELLGRLDAPAGEDLIGVVVMMMVVMAAAAMLVVVIMVVVVMMLMLVFIIVIVVMVMAAAAMLIMVIVVVVVVMMLVLVFIIVVVIMMMAAAAMLIMVIIVAVVMMVFVLFFLVLVGVLLVGLGSHSDQLSLEVVLGDMAFRSARRSGRPRRW